VGSFAATNIDNLAMLVSWLLSGRGDPQKIFSGYLIGMLGLLIFAYVFQLGAALIPAHFVGYLGLIPMALGFKGVYELLRAKRDPAIEREASRNEAIIFAVAMTQFANGMDTVLVFGPLLADSESGVDFAMVGGFIVMVLAWFRLARFLETRASKIPMIERYGHWISPVLLIVIGFYILDNTSTDLLPGE
jgi:cadmium resistance protein CadD (predicted permease)